MCFLFTRTYIVFRLGSERTALFDKCFSCMFCLESALNPSLFPAL